MTSPLNLGQVVQPQERSDVGLSHQISLVCLAKLHAMRSTLT